MTKHDWKAGLIAIAVVALGLMFPVKEQAQSGDDAAQPAQQPVCPFGYYGYAPYRCAPYGYYGPEWFVDGVFLGAGPWRQGAGHFYGHVDKRMDPRFGYRGPFPEPGPYVEPPDHYRNFHASTWSDEHGAYQTQAQHERAVKVRPE